MDLYKSPNITNEYIFIIVKLNIRNDHRMFICRVKIVRKHITKSERTSLIFR